MPLPPPQPSFLWKSSRWHGYLHETRRFPSGLATAEKRLSDEIGEQLAARLLPDDAPKAMADAFFDQTDKTGERVGRGVFGHLYGNPEERPDDPAWAAALRLAIETTSDIQDVRLVVGGDPDVTAIAAASLLRDLATAMPDLFAALDAAGISPDATPGDEGDESDGEGEGEGEGDESDGEGEGEGEGDESDGESKGKGGKVNAADFQAAVEAAAEALKAGLGSAARAAMDDATEMKDALEGLLPGAGHVDSKYQADPRRIDLYNKIKSDKRLQKVLRIAGRIQRVADRVKRVPSTDARYELIDIERGADLARILPSELMHLDGGDEYLELLTLKGIADRTLLQRQTSGEDTLGRGPITVLLDNSGSMGATLSDGLPRLSWAAAIAISAVRTGVEQRRAVAIAVFDDRVHTTWKIPAGDLRAAEQAILGLVGISPAGGTSYDQPIRWALDAGAEKDRADLVLVTDGLCYALQPNTTERLGKAKDKGLRLWGVIAGEGGLGDVLETFADGVTRVDPSTENAVVAIGQGVATR